MDNCTHFLIYQYESLEPFFGRFDTFFKKKNSCYLQVLLEKITRNSLGGDGGDGSCLIPYLARILVVIL